MTTKKIIVLKTGSTLEKLQQEQGDFEDWMIRGLDLPGNQTCTIDPRVDPFPALESIAGVVITGSHDMVTEHQDWSERSAAWLRTLVAADIPVLGICYGHQLLAYALGGDVGDNPKGREFGTILLNLAPEVAEDALLGAEYPTIRGYMCHTQTVLRAPAEAVVLATTDMDTCAAFRYGSKAWGVQFHPEFNLSALLTYIEEYQDILAAQGDDAQAIAASSDHIPEGSRILKRFGELCLQNKK